MNDDNPRPSKRQRRQTSRAAAKQVHYESSDESQPKLRPLPPSDVLVSLPGLLAHPPNHQRYPASLCLFLRAYRECLALPSLSPETECRAWLGLAEIGMKVIGGGLSQHEDHTWAHGVEMDVEKALTKGSILAQKHPSLRAYKHQLALLQAQLSHWQHKTKFARTQIRKLIASLAPTDPPCTLYSAHLVAITLFTTPDAPPDPTSSPSPQRSLQDIHSALSFVTELETISTENGHKHVTLLAHILRLRILVAANMWKDVADAVQRAESALGLSYEPCITPKTRKPQDPHASSPAAPASQKEAENEKKVVVTFDDAFESTMALHLLIMAVIYHTHVGNAAEVSPRLSHLHAVLDSGALEKFPHGSVEIALPSGPPLAVQVTHPRVLFLLAFLVSSVAKRDAVGRRPKRKVFAMEGLKACETEKDTEILFDAWAGIGDVEEVELRLASIKADLLCELAAVSIMRSEFDAAEENLDILIAHTRTYDLWPRYSARITLHHAHLAHALGQTARALKCYRVAEMVAEEGSFVQVAAQAGEACLRIGLTSGEGEGPEHPDVLPVSEEEGMRIARACRGMGGTLEAVGQVIEACISPEILKSKQHLKQALNIATTAQDNHLRALVLALIAAHYFHTAGDHARSVLQTCEQLAAGLGAPPTKAAGELSAGQTTTFVGNAPLRLWVGQRFLELYNRAGKEDRAHKQAAANAQLVKAVETLSLRSREILSLSTS